MQAAKKYRGMRGLGALCAVGAVAMLLGAAPGVAAAERGDDGPAMRSPQAGRSAHIDDLRPGRLGQAGSVDGGHTAEVVDAHSAVLRVLLLGDGGLRGGLDVNRIWEAITSPRP